MSPRSNPSKPIDVAIIGAGLSGLCLAVQLKKAGLSSFILFEKSSGIGGTWRDNIYPGAACDVPSHLYSFSFARKTDWSRKYAGQAEILGYAEELARHYGLYSHIRLNTELSAARFDAAHRLWCIRTRHGEEIAAKVLVSATGQLSRPHYPEVPGRNSFAGAQFHSARWDHSFDLTGKKVAVIGNGASAIQFIPRIASQVAKLHIFQRSANWLVPRNDRAYSTREKWFFRRVPLVERIHRYWIYWRLEMAFTGFGQGSRVGRVAEAIATKHMHRQVADPHLRKILRPDYPIGCKRVLIADDYYPALQRPNVEVLTMPVEQLTRDGIVTADGVTRPVDAIIYATGFESTRFLAPMEIVGLDDVPLEQAWRGGTQAYFGMTVPGFPNFFMLYGPNTNLGHNSIIFMIECQVGYIMRCLRRLLGDRAPSLDIERAAMARYQERLEKSIARTVWASGCRSWYKTADGKIINNWSGFTVEYWWRTRRSKPNDFRAI